MAESIVRDTDQGIMKPKLRKIWLCGLLFISSVLPAIALMAQQPTSRPLKIVASFYPVYIMARNVTRGIPGVTVTRLSQVSSGCLHDYAVTVDDLKRLGDADILVVNGAGMESFLDRVTMQFPGIKIVSLADGIPLIPGKGMAGPNPHVWVSITNAVSEVRRLAAEMARIDPAHAANYQDNAVEYTAKLESLSQQMHADLAQYKGMKIVTFHEAFPYFAREFGFDIAAVIEREPGSEPSARELAETIDIVKNTGVTTIFTEPQYPSGSANVISRETSARVFILDPAVSGEESDDAYLDIMRKNLEVLKNAFAER